MRVRLLPSESSAFLFSYESGQDSDDRNRGAEAWDFLKASSSGHAGNIPPFTKVVLNMPCLGLSSDVYESWMSESTIQCHFKTCTEYIDIIMSIKYLDDEDFRFASVFTTNNFILMTISENWRSDYSLKLPDKGQWAFIGLVMCLVHIILVLLLFTSWTEKRRFILEKFWFHAPVANNNRE